MLAPGFDRFPSAPWRTHFFREEMQMPTRTHILKSLIRRLSGASESAGNDAETIFRTFGETVQKRLLTPAGKTRSAPRRRPGRETSR